VRLPVAVFLAAMTVIRAPFGTLPGGTAVEVFTLTNGHGVEVRAMTYGATIISVRVPDRAGRMDDVVLGFDNLDDYLTKGRYFGTIVGRYGNRIGNGRFTLDGSTIQLTANNGVNHLHGGAKGFDKVVWKAEPFERDGNAGVTFSYRSPDGEEGYPGALEASVAYTLTPRNELILEYTARTDRAGGSRDRGYVGHGRPGTSRVTGTRATVSPRLVLGSPRGALRGRSWARLHQAPTDPGNGAGRESGTASDLPEPDQPGPQP